MFLYYHDIARPWRLSNAGADVSPGQMLTFLNILTFLGNLNHMLTKTLRQINDWIIGGGLRELQD
jgi:hypothetical protein